MLSYKTPMKKCFWWLSSSSPLGFGALAQPVTAFWSPQWEQGCGEGH